MPLKYATMSNVRCGPFKSYINQWGLGGGVTFPGNQCYEGVQFNVISVMMGWVSNFRKKSVKQLNVPFCRKRAS